MPNMQNNRAGLRPQINFFVRHPYWAYPEEYSHVAMRHIRRLDLIWEGDDVTSYDRLKEDAAAYGISLPVFVKEIIRKQLGNEIDARSR